MAEFSQNRSKRRDGEVLGGAVDFLLANARLVLGVGGAAVLGIATLAVKRVRLGWPADMDFTAGLGRWDCLRPHLPLPLTWLALPWPSRPQMPSPVTLCLQLIDRATSPRDEDDAKGDAPCLEDSWQDLSLLKATPRLQSRPPPAALSQPVPPPAPSLSAPGERCPFLSDLDGSCFGGHIREM